MSDLSNIETLRQYAKTIAAVAESMETNIEELESQFRRTNNNNNNTQTQSQTDDRGAIAEMKEELAITRKAASDIEELVGKIDRGEITDITESDIEQLVGKIDEN